MSVFGNPFCPNCGLKQIGLGLFKLAGGGPQVYCGACKGIAHPPISKNGVLPKFIPFGQIEDLRARTSKPKSRA